MRPDNKLVLRSASPSLVLAKLQFRPCGPQLDERSDETAGYGEDKRSAGRAALKEAYR